MAKKTTSASVVKYNDCPETLDDHPFYGLTLDEEQKKFRDYIWDKEHIAVFVNARAGTGKTLIAVATGLLLCKYGRYDGMIYVTAPVQEAKLGFLPGDAAQKLEVYNYPLYDALVKLNEDPARCIVKENMEFVKNGEAIIQCMSHVYQRGINFENKVVICDEAQNQYIDELKKVLTRCHDNCKVIVIGHSGQVDLYKNPDHSGFVPYIEHAVKNDKIAVCELNTNHRGEFSSWADDI